jgi:polyketide biosynthesis enoyl-CoA hydratase PksI
MSDETGRNLFSTELFEGLTDSFRQIAHNPDIRAVVLRGADGYFCSGASLERMRGPVEGRVDQVWQVLQSVFDCPVPVIAAVDGHAYGGGLLLALCCDMAVFSRSARYAANFLMYGFTPVGGASYLVPASMGSRLGSEMLFTGRTYRGDELEQRGAGPLITDHERVFDEASRTALRTAAAPRRSLELLKAEVVGPIREATEAAVWRERPAHEETIHRELLERAARRTEQEA